MKSKTKINFNTEHFRPLTLELTRADIPLEPDFYICV